MELNRCFWCDALLWKGLEYKDHVVPRKKGGPDQSWNIVPACLGCNSSKGALWPADFVQKRMLKNLLRLRDEYRNSNHRYNGARTDYKEFVAERLVFANDTERKFQVWASETGDLRALAAVSERCNVVAGDPVMAHVLRLERRIAALETEVEQQRRMVVNVDRSDRTADFKRMPNGHGSAGRHPSGLVHFRMQVDGRRVSGYGRDLDTAQANCRRKLEEIRQRLHDGNYEAQP